MRGGAGHERNAGGVRWPPIGRDLNGWEAEAEAIDEKPYEEEEEGEDGTRGCEGEHEAKHAPLTLQSSLPAPADGCIAA